MDRAKAETTSFDEISEADGIFRIPSHHLDQRGVGRIRRRDEEDLLEGDHLEDFARLRRGLSRCHG